MKQSDPTQPASLTSPHSAPCLHVDLSWKLTMIYGTAPGACFDNAHTILLSLRLPQMRYAEGWLVWEHGCVIKVIEHAWLELPDLGVLDPTIVWDERHASKLRYFAALRYSDGELADHSPEELPTVRYHPGEHTTTGLEHLDYQSAYQQAVFHARSLAERMTPPMEIVILPSYLRSEEISFIRLNISDPGLCIASVPDGMQEYIHAINTLFLYECPSRQMAGRLCAELRRRHHRATLQLFGGNWVVISQASEPELRALLPLLARFGATPIRVSPQTHQLLLSGVKRPQQRASCTQEEECSPAMESKRRKKRIEPLALSGPDGNHSRNSRQSSSRMRRRAGRKQRGDCPPSCSIMLNQKTTFKR